MSKHDLAVAARLKQFRKLFVDNHMDIAAPLLEISRGKLGNMESGETAVDVKVINLLQKKYGLNRDWLMDGKGNMRSNDTRKKTGLMGTIEMGDRIDKLTTEILILTKNLNKAWQIIERHEREIDRQAKEIEKLRDGSR